MISRNYTPPNVKIVYFEAQDVFLAISPNSDDGLYYDKWIDQTGGTFY